MLRISHFTLVAFVILAVVYSLTQSYTLTQAHYVAFTDHYFGDNGYLTGDNYDDLFEEDKQRNLNVQGQNQRYIFDKTVDRIPTKSGHGDKSIDVEVDPIEKLYKDERRNLLFTCPLKAERPSDSNNGIELLLHKANQESEFVIFEDKKVVWHADDIDLMVENGFNLSKPTLIYIGGWMQIFDSRWLFKVRDNYDKWTSANGNDEPYNLLFFDWGHYSYWIRYGKSVSLVPHMGNALGKFLEILVDRHGYKADQVHIIGYSLGTHIAALGGRKLRDGQRGSLAQITALDPTGVCFHGQANMEFGQRYGLRPNDAKLVLARHYNMNRFGAGRMIGGLDIIVNGGRVQPPMYGTGLKPNVIGQVIHDVDYHLRPAKHEAVEFNPDSDCQDIAYECSSFDQFKQGQCADCGAQNRSCVLVSTLGNIMLNRKLADMNYEAGTEMHLTTGVTQFCSYHYQVVAKLKPDISQEMLDAFAEGKFKFRLDVEVLVKPRYKFMDNDGGISFTQLLRLDGKIERFPDRISMNSARTELLKSLESVSINFMSNISPEVRAKNSKRYCPAAKSDQLKLVDCYKKKPVLQTA